MVLQSCSEAKRRGIASRRLSSTTFQIWCDAETSSPMLSSCLEIDRYRVCHWLIRKVLCTLLSDNEVFVVVVRSWPTYYICSKFAKSPCSRLLLWRSLWSMRSSCCNNVTLAGCAFSQTFCTPGSVAYTQSDKWMIFFMPYLICHSNRSKVQSISPPPPPQGDLQHKWRSL